MNFTVSVARRRDGLWQHVRHSFELDIVNTDQVMDFQIICPAGTSFPCFLDPLTSATRDAHKEQTQGVISNAQEGVGG